MTFTIGSLQPQEVTAFCDLFRQVFCVEMTPQWRAWKYEGGPRLGSVSLVARDTTGRLVGHAGALVFPGAGRGMALPMAQVCDVMVDASVRGGLDTGGVYGRLMQALRAALISAYPGVFAYGFAGIRPYKLGARMGLYRAVQTCRMGRIEDVRIEGRRSTGGARASGGRVPLQWLHRLRTLGLKASPADWHDRSLGRLEEHLGPLTPYPAVRRTPAYLRWRYAEHPLWHYQPWLLLAGFGRVAGWVITREMPDGSVCVMDALLPPDLDGMAAARQLDGALRGSSPGVNPQLSSWCFHTDAAARQEPIVGCEVLVDRWHSDRTSPRFHPGDTDVF